MLPIFRREIQSFFSSLSGYLVISIFLFATSILLWVFPSEYNLLSTGYANLDGLFDLGPWVLLFLAPAITMKMFAEERRQRTLELLLTRPVSRFQVVLGKFLAACFLVFLAMVPTLIYYFTVYYLGDPIGCIDSGAVGGSYLGMFLLATVYLAVGIFCSVITESQVISFLLAVVINMFLYNAFGVGSQLYPMSQFWGGVASLGLDEHYHSIARGVVLAKDIIYFLVMVAFFICAATMSLSWNAIHRDQKRKSIVLNTVFTALLLWGGTFVDFQLDLTEEGRYSLSDVSEEVISDVDFPIQVDLYLAGEMPAKFRVFQENITQKISVLDSYSSSPIHYDLIDPYKEVDPNKRQKYFTYLSQKGLTPTDIRIKKSEGTTTQLLFPAMVVKGNGKEIVVNLLKRNSLFSSDQNLNNSTELLEYEMVRAIYKLKQKRRDRIAFLTDGNPLDPKETFILRKELSEDFDFVDLSAEGLRAQQSDIAAVIIADPKKDLSERTKFIVDQYVMNGGRLAVFIDPISVSLDSLEHGMTTIAIGREFSLRDQLFQYGVRINSDLVQDVDCMRLPVNTALPGQKPKYTPAPWYFSPLLMPNQSHPIGKGLDRVKSDFVSSITPTKRHEGVSITPVLTTSPYALLTNTPLEISLALINQAPKRELFNKSRVPVGVVMEGSFHSSFEHRMPKAFGFDSSTKVKGRSEKTKMLVVADGRILSNEVKVVKGRPRYAPMGYDRFSKQTFGNKEFVTNALRYLTDRAGISSLSGRVLKMRLLDKVKLQSHRFMIQFLNVLLPQLFLIIVGTAFYFVRRSRYR
ncbi:gliding motility-associated ABC transporter substrate-binding protein GldG [Halosquirtibacter xylanolyticus]|uniref:gliding motility-associated ABC transporter substrate-binding protein GldG n=1 Tax=Halosquirtibacter xylanolyticus TaxID=3374599 RepID=UPI003749F090|nr:gliding motility-associated ABC transporter substrate-binding protein GldG [Prolixibacteraceae bacterium]